MPRRLTNLLLLVLVLALAGSGLLGWLLAEPGALPLYGLHRALGVGLLVVLVWKLPIARGSLARRVGRRRAGDRAVLVGVLAGLALLGCLGLGLGWTLGLLGRAAFGGYSPLNLHVFLGLGLLPLMLWHLLRRWERRPAASSLLGRRSALRLLGLSAATLAGWRLLERAAEAWADEPRRPSGSKHAGSWSGNDFPVTIWAFDQVPRLDPATWRLELSGKLARPGARSLDQLLALPRRDRAVALDCTGGWWSEQRWQGIALGDLLEAHGLEPGARQVTVISVTGHRWSFPLAELSGALLGTHVGGQPLTPGHGYPVRLVAPGRRGFQWVKWVGWIEVA
jgi:DMSO/TMAO reductase YedYZ molybdopterin-dependent catalytic subunit